MILPSPNTNPSVDSATDIADCIEAFEDFNRNAQNTESPVVEKALYTFDDLSALQLLPQEVFWARQGDEVETVDVTAVRQKERGNTLAVQFQQQSGGLLRLSRSALSAKSSNSPFVLTRKYRDANRPTDFVDSVSPDAVAKFLIGLAVGPQNRSDMLEKEKVHGLARLDPQSSITMSLLMTSLTKYAAYSENRSLYRKKLKSDERSTDMSVEVLKTSEGNAAYEMSATSQETDGEETRSFDVAMAIAHDYSRTTVPEADIYGILTISNNVEVERHTLATNGLISYAIAILKAAAPDPIRKARVR